MQISITINLKFKEDQNPDNIKQQPYRTEHLSEIFGEPSVEHYTPPRIVGTCNAENP